jgi:glycosyltransferase involved in cell wall biosynthesis
MNILYDHQIFSWQKIGGISRYFVQIMKNKPSSENTRVSVKYSDNLYLRDFLGNKIETRSQPLERFLKGWHFRGKAKLLPIAQKINPDKYLPWDEVNKNSSIKQLKKQSFDLFHPTYYDDYFLKHIGNKPFVLTIYDMIHELFPDILNDSQISIWKKELALKAAHIIAISENTKKDIIDILGIPEEKISVIYLASSLIKRENKLSNLPQNYILYVGSRASYKNFPVFAQAIAPIIKQKNDIFVVCLGENFSTDEILFLTNLGIRDNFVSILSEEDDMFEIYNKAIAFVFPSYYEGFGIPILEAFESSCPVILSNSSCFPEIARDCAMYFSPMDVNQMQYWLENVIDDSSLRQSMIAKGMERIKDFSWTYTAKQTFDVYERVLKNE